MTEWRIVVNDGEETLDDTDGLYDVRTVDTFNPFGDYATAMFDDLVGSLFETFTRGTKVSFQYNAPYTTGFVEDFVGFVVNDFANDAQGAEQLEVEAYSFDQFLRGNEVSNPQEGNLISEALEDVIKNDVPPVSWDASLVDVVDDNKLTQEYQGENVEDFLLNVRNKSSGEIFSVTEDLRFEFALAEAERTRRDIDNTQWITHDIARESGETKNQVTVFYDAGNAAVTVDDSGDQLNIQDNLGTPGPAQQSETITRENITSINDAITVGEQYLKGKAETLTGPVTTSGLIDAQPGEVIGVQIEPRGIDGDFRIAENRTSWINETNELVLVRKKGADDDLLINQSKTLKRVEGRPRDTSVTPARITDTKVTALFDVSVSTTSGVASDIGTFVNSGRKRIQAAVINEDPVANTELVFSTSDTRPNRADGSIPNVVDTTAVSVSVSGSTVTASASTTSTGIQTVGLRDSGTNDLLAIARLSEPVSSPSVDLAIEITNDNTTNKSVLTTTGQEFLANILANNTPSWPETYAYGSGTIDPAESDTSLTTQETTQDLDSKLIQSANTTTEFGDILDIADTEPLAITTGRAELLQSAYSPDTANVVSYDGTLTTDAGATDGRAIKFDNQGSASWSITTEYDIPVGDNSDASIAIRARAAGTNNQLDPFGTIDGDSVPSPTGQLGTSYSWQKSDIREFNQGEKVEAGSHTIGVFVEGDDTDPDDAVFIDRVVLFDNRFNYTFDNTLNTNDQLAGPELYPDGFRKDLATAETQQLTSEASIDTVFNDVSSNQYVELSNDGTNYQRISNSETGSITFNSPQSDVDSRINFSRFGNRTDDTPTQGFNGQSVFVWELFSNPRAVSRESIGTLEIRAILSGTKASGSSFAEAGLRNANGTLLTHSLIPKFNKQSGQQVVSSELLRLKNA